MGKYEVTLDPRGSCNFFSSTNMKTKLFNLNPLVKFKYIMQQKLPGGTTKLKTKSNEKFLKENRNINETDIYMNI